MIEGSSSLNQWGENNFEKIVNATKQIVNYFTDPQSKIGIVLYATNAEVKANFSFPRNQVNNVLANLEYPSGTTRIGTALNATKEELFVDTGSNAHRVLIVFTDGTSTVDVSVASDILHDVNVTVITIALGEWYDIKQVQRMASDPYSKTTFLTTFDELESRRWKMHEIICEGNEMKSICVNLSCEPFLCYIFLLICQGQ